MLDKDNAGVQVSQSMKLYGIYKTKIPSDASQHGYTIGSDIPQFTGHFVYVMHKSVRFFFLNFVGSSWLQNISLPSYDIGSESQLDTCLTQAFQNNS